LAPSVVSVSHHDLNSLLISWTPGFSPFNVETLYNIYATPPVGQSRKIGTGTRDRQISFPVSDVCGSTEFRVHSSNQAGASIGYAQNIFSGLISKWNENIEIKPLTNAHVHDIVTKGMFSLLILCCQIEIQLKGITYLH